VVASVNDGDPASDGSGNEAVTVLSEVLNPDEERIEATIEVAGLEVASDSSFARRSDCHASRGPSHWA
jgi:hypothetical protein